MTVRVVNVFLGMVLLLSIPARGTEKTEGAVVQSNGNVVSQNPQVPKLNLTAAQREQLRETLLPKHTEIEFQLKTTKSAKDFSPQIGAKLPKGIKPDGLPSELTKQIPQLADFSYVKMKDQILIVNALTGRIAEIIPETQPQTTGHQ